MVPIYIAAIATLMLASAVWRYRQRITACLLMAVPGAMVLLLP